MLKNLLKMAKINLLVSFISILFMNNLFAQNNFDWQGHRGCRGLLPENSIPAFIKATELGVTTLELDVVITKGNIVLVSHEPWMSPEICLKPDGTPFDEEEAKKFTIYSMTLDEVQAFDCGSKAHPRFPDQKKIPVIKPTLEEAIIAVKRYCFQKKIAQPLFNIEIKSQRDWYGTLVPKPKEFVDLLVKEIRHMNVEKQTTLQSFDPNVLEELNKVQNKTFHISYLVFQGKSIKKNLKLLSFTPDIYSPDFSLLNKKTINQAHKLGIKVVPWTINDQADMRNLIEMGVDGIITDYPNLILSTN